MVGGRAHHRRAEGVVDYGVSWQQVVQTLGEAQEQERADEPVTGIDEAFAAAREEHPESAGAEAVPAMVYEGVFVYGPQDPRERLLAELGLALPESLAGTGTEEFGQSISAERADLLDLDALVWFSAADEVDAAVPTYGSLAMAREGRDVLLPEGDPLRTRSRTRPC